MKTATITNVNFLNDFKPGQCMAINQKHKFLLENLCHFLFIFHRCHVRENQMNFAVFLGPFLFSCNWSEILLFRWFIGTLSPLQFWWHQKGISSFVIWLWSNSFACLLVLFLSSTFASAFSLWSCWPASSISEMMLSQSSHLLLLSQPQSSVAPVENTMVQRREIGLNEITSKQMAIKKFKSLIVPWAFSSKFSV